MRSNVEANCSHVDNFYCFNAWQNLFRKIKTFFFQLADLIIDQEKITNITPGPLVEFLSLPSRNTTPKNDKINF